MHPSVIWLHPVQFCCHFTRCKSSELLRSEKYVDLFLPTITKVPSIASISEWTCLCLSWCNTLYLFTCNISPHYCLKVLHLIIWSWSSWRLGPLINGGPAASICNTSLYFDMTAVLNEKWARSCVRHHDKVWSETKVPQRTAGGYPHFGTTSTSCGFEHVLQMQLRIDFRHRGHPETSSGLYSVCIKRVT